MIGHFTVMVNDKNDAVGCAMVRFQRNGFKYNYFVCNYGYTNMLKEPVYKKGKTASKCKTVHKKYKGLCSSVFKTEESTASEYGTSTYSYTNNNVMNGHSYLYTTKRVPSSNAYNSYWTRFLQKIGIHS